METVPFPFDTESKIIYFQKSTFKRKQALFIIDWFFFSLRLCLFSFINISKWNIISTWEVFPYFYVSYKNMCKIGDELSWMKS